MDKVILGLKRCLDEQKSAVIATIIQTEGSTYQASGTRCLIREDGGIEGLVSGGCVEQDLAERVGEVISTFATDTIVYDFRAENDLLWGMGLGCEGAVTLFLQPFDPVNHLTEALTLYDQLMMNYETNTPFTVATIIKSSDEAIIPVGSMRFLSKTGESIKVSTPTYRANILFDGVMTECFVEAITPRQHVTIFGAGPDVAPVVNQLATINWRTTVIDHRPLYAKTEYFPKADEVLLINRSGYENITLNKNTYALVMTHNYELDVQLLKELILADVPYIGILGATKRIENIKGDMRSNDLMFQEGVVHSPIGLDLGAKTPDEIAISIVAELLAFKRGKEAKSRIVVPSYANLR